MNRTLLTLVIACALVMAASLLFMRDTGGEERIRALESEVLFLRQQLQAASGRKTAEPMEIGTFSADASPVASGSDPSGLDRQLANLSQTMERLQQAAQELDQRISHSKLALPSRQERESRVAVLKKEVQGQTEKRQAAVEAVRQVANQFGVKLDDRALSDVGIATPLDNQPAFIEARTRAAQALRILNAAERVYENEQVELLATPP